MTVPLSKSGADILDQHALVDRRMLNAERDIARANRRVMSVEHALQTARTWLDQARREKAAEQDRVRALQHQIDQLYASTSWRVSRPVRAISALVHRLRRPLPGHPAQTGTLPASPLPITQSNPARADQATLRLGFREQAILQRLQGGTQT